MRDSLSAAPGGRDALPHSCDGHPIVRWSALATGSLIGIASWTSLYLLGAVVAWSIGVMPSGDSFFAGALLGVYGCMAASLALGLASYTAARTGGACDREGATFYGLCLWSLSTLTLVGVTLAASSGCFAALSSEAGAIFEIGLATVGLQMQPQGTPSPTYVLWAMFVTVAVSLLFAVVAARRAVASRRPVK